MDQQKLNILMEGVHRAALVLKKHLGRTTEFSKVSRFDYGIPTDKAVEKILLNAVKETALDCKIVSEEAGVLGNLTGMYQVYIDPLDGSVNFSRGIPSYCIGIGVYQNDQPRVGIIFDPNTYELFVAEYGKGVTLNGKPFKPVRHDGSLFINVEWFGADNFQRVTEALREHYVRARVAGCGVLALLYGCIGRGDGTILVQNKPWDVAPGLVFARELECKISSFDGTAIDLSQAKFDVIAAKDEQTYKLLEGCVAI